MPLNAQIIQEAAEWFVEFSSEEPDSAARRRFTAWLRASPEHLRAYLEMLPIWEDVGSPCSETPEPESLIAAARASNNIVPLSEESDTQAVGLPLFRRTRWVAVVGVAASLIAAVAAIFFWLRLGVAPTYVTGIGEQHSVALADGSVIDLNACSSVRVRYSPAKREIELLRGQALFRVAKDRTRPFEVLSGQTRVLATGTQFDVYRRTSGTTVTVLEGSVAVSRDSKTALPEIPAVGTDVDSRTPKAPVSTSNRQQGVQVKAVSPSAGSVAAPHADDSTPLMLLAGEQVTVSPRRTSLPTHANIMAATAWTQRQLVFDETPLPQVAEDFNRYNTRQLVIQSSRLDQFLVSGVFSSTDPGSLLRFLSAQPGVRIGKVDDKILVIVD